MPDILLDPKLKEDCHLLGHLENNALLLMRNSLFPWFVLVPHTSEIEFYKLDAELQMKLVGQINLVSQFIEDNYSIDKLNIGSIGNIVSQLHVHIIGRSHDDECWPDVVWGVKKFKPYEQNQVSQIKEKLLVSLQNLFRAK